MYKYLTIIYNLRCEYIKSRNAIIVVIFTYYNISHRPCISNIILLESTQRYIITQRIHMNIILYVKNSV